ncbi:hypothetical protein PCANC_04265 [Puccinia coronata f. sp. avenae]|uniref:Uncharacterized protein n=1 Tax=Puccinia coronata f. sp. avenae TaxID=200324 RepID=A0A2N5S9V1_9BASI|nr:hypothetical protein PCANC_26947 [Puccinia coronata f. sp. avenae]PLW54531.1 hypothetical protein PCANC_04265 [Puccinia coronata f. sp. avenae]
MDEFILSVCRAESGALLIPAYAQELALAVTHSLPLVQWTLRLGYEGWRSVAFQRATVRRSINQTHYEAFQVTYPT